MKKTLSLLALVLIAPALFAFTPDKTIKVEMQPNDWAVYFRNVARLDAMAGRVVTSEILLATKDTLQYFHQHFADQLQKQMSDTTKQKIK